MAIDPRVRQFGTLFSGGIEQQEIVSRAELRRRRHAILSETTGESLTRRLALAARTLQRDSRRALPSTLARLVRDWTAGPAGLPEPGRALPTLEGFCGHAGDLSVGTMFEAISRGLCPQPFAGGIGWFSPLRRMIVSPGQARIPSRVRAHLRRNDLLVTFDRDFEQVLAACARADRRQFSGLAHPPTLMLAFASLHDSGFAHSFEVRDRTRLLAGGFGVGVGSVFVTLRTFGEPRDAVDLGLTVLNRHLTRWGFTMHDGCLDERFVRFGGRAVPREDYLRRLSACVGGGMTGRWSVDPALCHPMMPPRLVPVARAA